MKTSKQGIDLIARHEGLRLKAYRCPAGILTIGYGHTGNVKEGDVITEDYARYLLASDLSTAENAVSKHLPKLNQNQFDALVSFVFNCGQGAFAGSTLLKNAKANVNDPTIAAEFAKWNKAGGKVLPGLVKRRADEAKLYFE